MSRIPIESLANGVLLSTVPFVSSQNPTGAPMLTPAVNQAVEVYAHGTTTPAVVWSQESGGSTLALPLTTGADGAIPGWIDPTTLPLDLVVTGRTYVLASPGGTGGVTTFNTRSGVISLTKADVTGTGLTAADVGADPSGAASTEQARAIAAEATFTSGLGFPTALWVTADATVPDGTTDNTVYLAGRLAVALAAGATLRIPAGKNGNWVINKLTLPSSSSVDATGATFVQANGVNTRMVLNTALTLGTPGSARDTNIRWRGGTFIKGAGQTNVGKLSTSPTGLDDHCTMFGFVDGLNVSNITFQQSGTGGDAGTGGRYGCYVWNCTNFSFENFNATSISQAVNQSSLQLAYCQGGHIKGVYGTYGDDVVALVNGNQVGDTLVNGPSVMENILVEDVFATSPSSGVRLMPGSTAGVAPFYNLQHCAVRNVRGSFASRGGTAAVYFGGATSGYPNLQNGTLQDVEASDIVQTRAGTPAAFIDGTSEVYVTLRRVNNQNDSTAITAPTSSGHQRIKVTDCVFTSTITSGTQYPITCGSTTVRSLELDNITLNAAITGTATVGVVNATGGPALLVATNIRTTGKCFALGTFTATTKITVNGINMEDANGLGYFQTNTGAVVTVRGWNGVLTSGVNNFTQTAGTVAVVGAGGTSLPGASGTAVLVAGTVVVNTGSGMATAGSLVRLTNVAAAGTLGDHSVARGSNTFTINSNNAADTSTLFWEIVSS